MFPESGGEDRLTLLAPAGTTYVFDLELPSEPGLRIGLGYLPPESADGSLIRFNIGVAAEGSEGAETVLDTTLPFQVDGGWQDVELDLSRWSGRSVALSLRVSATSPDTSIVAAWSAPEIVSRRIPEEGLDVVLIVLDTLRADRLGCYGYESATTPNLDEMAAKGARFATAVSQSPWTRPSHKAIFSSLYPTTSGLGDQPVLQELLREVGYRTEAMTGGGQMDFRMGFARGFDTYRVFDWIRDLDAVDDWLGRSDGRRRFLFLHTYEVHDPYIHAELVADGSGGRVEGYFDKRRWEELRGSLTEEEKKHVEGLYDGGVAYTDQRLGLLFDLFRRTDVFDRSIVLITSDHGEQFWEHGTWRHGMSLHDHQLLVPLIVHLPPGLKKTLSSVSDLSGRVFEEQVRLIDLFPTVLDLLGVPIEHRIDGRSLRPLLEGDGLPPVDAFAERLNVNHRESKALRSHRFKYIHNYPKEKGKMRGLVESQELFDLTRDPGEQVNVAAQYPEQVAELDARLQILLALLADPSEIEDEMRELDPDLERRLRALGYLGN
jgi:arylsulfatase A-like enzyme